MPIFVCALSCEAKPLIETFQLKLVCNELPFRIYEKGDLKLIVTGVGKVASAIGCGYLGGKYSLEDDLWINIGICGAKKNLGSPFLVNKIVSENKKYYPNFTFPLPCFTLPLITVDTPQKNLEENVLYDMEGAGFFAAASHFSTVEYIHCLKIVSDNGAKHLNKEEVSSMVKNQIPLVNALLQSLKPKKPKEEELFANLSRTERKAAHRLVAQCKALGLTPPLTQNLQQLKSFVQSHVPAHLR